MSVLPKSSFGQRVGNQLYQKIGFKEDSMASKSFAESRDNLADGPPSSVQARKIRNQQAFENEKKKFSEEWKKVVGDWKELVTVYPKSVMFLAIIIFGSLFGGSGGPDLSTAEGRQEAALLAKRVKFERCISPWDGSNSVLVAQVKARLRDPSSFEHIETKYAEASGMLTLIMTYRAKNGFGGYNLEQATGSCYLN